MGSQWLSDPYQQRVREMIRERQDRQGRLHQPELEFQRAALARPRKTRTSPPSASRIPTGSAGCWAARRGHSIRRVYFEFRIFKDFSGGITDQWYSHGSGLAHFYLDTFIPDDTVANGGIFAWHDVRENPDTFQCLSTFHEKEVLYSYSTTFGNGYGDHTIIRGTRGTLYSPGGEGSPQWWFLPETRSGWRVQRRLRSAHGQGRSPSR